MAINLKSLQPHKVSRDLTGYITYIYGQAKTGKAQPITTVIPTPDGDRYLGDLKEGDYVFDRCGKPTKILKVFPQGKLDNYKITFEDGRYTFCNEEHLWTYCVDRGRLKTITLKEMINRKPQLLLPDNNVSCYFIPNNKAVEYPFNPNLAVDPYVLGCFLGDGCCKERMLTISSNDEELVAEVAKRLNCNYRKLPADNYSWTFPLKERIEKYYNNIDKEYLSTEEVFMPYVKQVCCGAAEKRIPEEYFYGSIEQRMELLQGLMDTDGGFVTAGDYPIKFSTICEGLRDDFIRLCNSLGYRATWIEDKRGKNKYPTTGHCYSIRICVPNSEKYKLFKLSRKVEIGVKLLDIPIRRDFNKIGIRRIEKMEEQEEMICLYVDNDEHLYLTNDYIVTHNTTLASQMPKPLLLAFERGLG